MLCTNDPVIIQIWTMGHNEKYYKLKWQIQYNAEYFAVQDAMTVVCIIIIHWYIYYQLITYLILRYNAQNTHIYNIK